MSQISERTNVISIDTVLASLVNLREMSTYQPIQGVFEDIDTICPSNLVRMFHATSGGLRSANASTTVCSPNALRTTFGQTFSTTIKQLEKTGVSSLDAKKGALLASLSKMDFKVSELTSVKASLKGVLQTKDEKALITGIKTVMGQLEVAHTKVFTQNLANACARASMTVGFKQVEIKPINGKLEVIATNHIGQRLVSEISVDAKTNQVNASTETIGISDGSCNSIIVGFNDELKKMGIKLGSEKTTFTGGACQLPYSKLIDQQGKVALQQKKELERTKKLNTGNKQKN